MLSLALPRRPSAASRPFLLRPREPRRPGQCALAESIAAHASPLRLLPHDGAVQGRALAPMAHDAGLACAPTVALPEPPVTEPRHRARSQSPAAWRLTRRTHHRWSLHHARRLPPRESSSAHRDESRLDTTLASPLALLHALLTHRLSQTRKRPKKWATEASNGTTSHLSARPMLMLQNAPLSCFENSLPACLIALPACL